MSSISLNSQSQDVQSRLIEDNGTQSNKNGVTETVASLWEKIVTTSDVQKDFVVCVRKNLTPENEKRFFELFRNGTTLDPKSLLTTKEAELKIDADLVSEIFGVLEIVSPSKIRDIGIDFIKKGHIDRLIKEIFSKSPDKHDAYFKSLSLLALGENLIEQATMVAKYISDQNIKLAVYIVIYTKEGNFDKAIECLKGIHKDTSDYRIERNNLVFALIKADKLDKAFEVASGIQDKEDKSMFFKNIAEAYAKAGATEMAEKIARSIPAERQQLCALESICEALASAGKLEEAEKIARSIPAESQQSCALESICKALASAGKLEEAQRIAKSLPAEYRRPYVLSDICMAFASEGKFEEAIRLAKILPEDRQPFALQDICKALTSVGKFEEAQRIAKSLPHEESQSFALQHLCIKLAENQRDKAILIANSIPNESIREITIWQLNN